MKLNDKLFSTLRSATRKLVGKDPQGATSAIQDALKILTPGAPRPAPQSAQPVMRDINPPPQGRDAKPAASPPPPPPPQAQAQAQAEAEPAAAAPQNPHLAAAMSNPHVAAAMKNLPPDLLATLNQAMQGGGAMNMPNFDASKFDLSKFDLSKFDMGKFDLSKFEMPSFDMPGGARGPAEPMPGEFIDGSFTCDAGTRSYKLYVPSTYTGEAVPLVVMLHGCTQDPDDFATGTQMNHLAEEMRCLVVYPAQSQQANSSRCWNWFSAKDQQREQGEPSIIAGITRAVIHNYKVDEAQVYVAGLSAGGAMATIMGHLYPDLYAAVGVHSGLPFASAKDLPSALAAMQGNFGKPIPAGKAIPIIVFHGDRDTTVHPVNGEELIRQGAHPTHQVAVEPGSVPNGHRYTKAVHHSGDGTPHAEHWTIHGAGHAWSGGSGRGSYTDGKGPDASREMMRFFTTKRV